MIPEIRKPEITKKTSTPINPPGNTRGKAWNMMTDKIESARSPSMSARYPAGVDVFSRSGVEPGSSFAVIEGDKSQPRRAIRMHQFNTPAWKKAHNSIVKRKEFCSDGRRRASNFSVAVTY